MKSQTIELIKVSGVGAIGWLATIKLADVATLVSICVGLATIFYVLTKTYFVIKNKGREPSS